MRRAVAVAVLALLTAALAADPPEKDKEPADKPTDRLVPVGTIGGIVQDPGGSSGRLMIRVDIPYLEANVPAQQNYVQRQQQLLQRQQAILRNPNPQQRYQQMQQLVRDALALMAGQKDLFHIRHKHQDVELSLAEDVKVRTARAPQGFDDKGNIKRYTPKEIRDLRGPDHLPGFTAAVSDLEVGQTVLVKVAVRRRVPPGKKADKDVPQESQKDKPAPPAEDGKPLAVLILIADLRK